MVQEIWQLPFRPFHVFDAGCEKITRIIEKTKMGSGVSSAYYSDVPISLYDGSNTLNDIMEKSRA